MAFIRYPRVRGTSLIEVLVVIVIFLVGILAVAQIFPKGFQILINSRNQSVMSALARDEVERLEAHSAELPMQIVSAAPDANGNMVINPSQSPLNLGPMGNPANDAIDSFGNFYVNGVAANGSGVSLGQATGPIANDDWTRYSGPNSIRHIIGESRIVPAPRLVGSGSAMYGGLILLNFGPVDFYTNATTGLNSINVYGNDLTPVIGFPNVGDQHTDDEYFIANPLASSITLGLPAGPVTLPSGSANSATARQYIVSFSAYVPVSTGSSTYVRRDYTGLTVSVPNGSPDANGVLPIFSEPLTNLVPNLGSIDVSSLRVDRAFLQIPPSANWTTYEPYVCKLVNPQLGVILFSPNAFGLTIKSPAGPSPLQARFDYDVYDWRIIREDFRFPTNQIAQHQLAIGSLKIGGQPDFDGLTTSVMLPLEGGTSPTYSANVSSADNFVLVDIDTGGVYMEKNLTAPVNASFTDTYLTVNKSTGLVTVRDLDNGTPGTQANLLLPDGSLMQNVTIDGRALRALYIPKGEFSVQVLKAASSYTESPTTPGAGQFVTGLNLNKVATRIYFPVTDLGRKVTAGVINYRRPGDTTARQLHDQDFVIAFPAISDGAGLPCIDVTNVDYQAQTLDVTSFGYAVGDVKGASVAVRALWNADFFQLGSDTGSDLPGSANGGNFGGNITRVLNWDHGWRQAINETYLEQGDLIP